MRLADFSKSVASLDGPAFQKHYPEPALVFLLSKTSPVRPLLLDVLSGRKASEVFTSTTEREPKRPTTFTRKLKRKEKVAEHDPLTESSDVAKIESGAYKIGDFAVEDDSPVVFLQKSPRNPFANMITVGRAPNNDLWLSLPSISKAHAYFMRGSDKTWKLYDQRATNGTHIERSRLEPGATAPLQDGVQIDFGPDVRARFFTPQGLRAFCASWLAGGA